ncbi:MAG: hypothetical protein NVSMB33_06590 [Ktedonobacteraceae bacterium]
MRGTGNALVQYWMSFRRKRGQPQELPLQQEAGGRRANVKQCFSKATSYLPPFTVFLVCLFSN